MGGKKKAVKRESAANAAIKEVKAETAAIIGKQEPKFSDDQLIDALKAVGHSATSREVSDKLDIKNADYGRQMVRARMVELIKAGKVAVDEPEKGRAKKLYKVA